MTVNLIIYDKFSYVLKNEKYIYIYIHTHTPVKNVDLIFFVLFIFDWIMLFWCRPGYRISRGLE